MLILTKAQSVSQISCLGMSNSLRPHGLWHSRRPCPSPTPGAYSNSCPSHYDTIQSSHPLSSPSPPTFDLSQHQGLFQWVSSSHHVAKVLDFHLQHQSFRWVFRTDFLEDWLVWSPCSPRDSQESSPAPQFKSINSLVLSFLYRPIFATIHDYWKKKGSPQFKRNESHDLGPHLDLTSYLIHYILSRRFSVSKIRLLTPLL